MNKILLPSSYNYIGVFLTLRCNLNCDYCINHFGKLKQYDELSGTNWIRGLSRIETREDLPLTLQGGEPTLHKDFYTIVRFMHSENKKMDLLTNGLFDLGEFYLNVPSCVFNRQAKYASIRFSFHKDTNLWGLALKVQSLRLTGYSVGIWGFNSPLMGKKNKEMADLCKCLGIDYREKEFLDENYKGYKYPDAVSRMDHKPVMCRASELLIAPDGYIFRCHSDLYAGINPIAHILDEKIVIDDVFRRCDRYGLCNPCDVKIKTNRFQEGGHTSVEIKI